MKEVTVHVHNGIDYLVNTDGRCGRHSCTHNVYNSFDEPEMIKVMRVITLNEDDMGCSHHPNNRVGCGTCGRSWCDICHPTPSARCLYEYDHDEVIPDPGVVISKADRESVELMVDGEYIKFRPVADYSQFGRTDPRNTALTPDDEDLLNVRPGWWTDEDEANYVRQRNQVSSQANGPCPVCNESGGFHDDNKHRNNIDHKYLLDKGWHNG